MEKMNACRQARLSGTWGYVWFVLVVMHAFVLPIYYIFRVVRGAFSLTKIVGY